MNKVDGLDQSPAQLGNAFFDVLALFRSRMIDRIHEVNAMTEKEVMGAADQVHAIFGAASEQIARLRTLLRGSDSPDSGDSDELTVLIDAELKAAGDFAAELNAQVIEQVRLTRAAEQALSGINEAATQVGTFAARAKMLALNARIEASRGSASARGFAVIADEMKDLSRGVAETNASIQQLAHNMVGLLPGIVRGANLMHQRSAEFSGSLAAAMRKIGERSGKRRQEIATAVDESDQTLSRIVSNSQGALSHLQFQDAVAQGLMRLDSMLVETQLSLCTMAGLQSRKAQISPPIHVEIGGDKAVQQTEAGQVLLF